MNLSKCENKIPFKISLKWTQYLECFRLKIVVGTKSGYEVLYFVRKNIDYQKLH